MTQIIKSQSVMHLDEALRSEGYAGFRNGEPNREDVTRALAMDVDDWVDFGRPSTITITIEPGDLLNVEGEK